MRKTWAERIRSQVKEEKMKKIKGIEEANGFIQQPVLTDHLSKGYSGDGKNGLESHSSSPARREQK